jgi:hypothetical protein
MARSTNINTENIDGSEAEKKQKANNYTIKKEAKAMK